MNRLKINTIYSQNDLRWRGDILGFNTDGKYNLGNYGCLITCLAMVAEYYGISITPKTINEVLKTKKGYLAGGGLYIYGSFSKIYPQIKEKRITTPYPLTDSQINEIKSAIDSKYPVMIQLDYNPKTVEADQHFVLIIGYNPNDENDFLIADPIDGREKSLKSYLGWLIPSARKTNEQYLIYEGQPPSDDICINKMTYDFLIHNSDQWRGLIWYLEIDKVPEDVFLSEVKKEIEYLKNRIKLDEERIESLKSDLAIAMQEIVLKTEEFSKQEKELLKKIETEKSENIALKEQVKELQKGNNELANIVEEKTLEIEKIEKDLLICKENLKKDSFIDILFKWLKKTIQLPTEN